MSRPLRTLEVPARRLPIMAEGDVVVIGGGTAGFVAAVAAARLGARTILIERYGYLAGCLTGTYATTPGFFGDSEGNQVVGGIGWEFVERMERAGAAIVRRDAWSVQLFPEAAKAVALEMVLEANVELYLHAWAGEVLLKDGMIQGIIVQSKSGREIFSGQTYVDATGDADIAHLAGAPCEKLEPDRLWQTSVDLTLCNVDAQKVIAWARENEERVIWLSTPKESAVAGLQPMVSFIIREESETKGEGDIVHIGPVPTVKLLIHRSISRVQGSVEVDGTDVRDLTRAEVEARHRAMDHLEYLKRTVPGYEEAIVIGESPLGVRETRRIIGEYVLTLDDLLRNARFPDVVALNARALDRHLKGDVFKFDLLVGNHDIPLRALIPQGVRNLLVAGRCISSDHEAHASLRGAATCMATGHAAGAAAALAAGAGGQVRALDISALQRTLKAQGAILSTGQGAF